MTDPNRDRTAEEIREARKAERRLRLLDLHEEIAVKAELATTDRLRKAYADLYRSRIGVRPDQRHAFRTALRDRVNVTVDVLVESFAGA